MVGDLKSTKPRSLAKRDAITEAAMRHFAEHGYQGARVEDLARELGIAKGSIFQHFGSKAGLFLATYKRAVSSLPAWLDAPSDVVETGFWSVLVYWLERTEHLIRDDWVPYRVSLIGNYGTDLTLKRDINRFLLSEDPYGTLDFVEFDPGLFHRRSDDPQRRRAQRIHQFTELLRSAIGPGRAESSMV